MGPLRIITIFLSLILMGGCASTRFARDAEGLNKRITEAQNSWRMSHRAFYGDRVPLASVTLQGRVQNILNRIIYVSPLRGYSIPVYIIDDEEINASTDGKRIYLNSGLLQALGQDDSLLAAILAHEVGHILAHHMSNQDRTSNIIFSSMTPLLGFTKIGSYISLAVREGMRLHQKSYSRFQEKEADAIGAILAYEAGYDPYGLSRFFDNKSESLHGFKAHASIPAVNYANPGSIARGASLYLLRASPLYKTHPPSQERKKVVDLIARVKHGKLSTESLEDENEWLSELYEVIEFRRPKTRPH